MLKRRDFIKQIGSGIAVSLTACTSTQGSRPQTTENDDQSNDTQKPIPAPHSPITKMEIEPVKPMVHVAPQPVVQTTGIEKIRNFNKDFQDDLFLEPNKIKLLRDTAYKLTLIKNHVGYGHFNLISFDDAIRYCRNLSRTTPFTKVELDFLDEIFYFNATSYGFKGDKVLTRLTDKIQKKETIKVPATGHYLFAGEAHDLYIKIRKELGSSIILTSGIRGIVKQMHLFLIKALKVNANMSRASRSLAPPGHSYHAIGDFDVGKKGLGASNFSSRFAATEEYKKLKSSGYISIRYTEDNPFGVRYEPWHIKVVKS